MLGEKNFDERQLQIRGQIGYQTTFLALILIMVSAFFSKEIQRYVDMSDYLICLTYVILTYFSLNVVWRDAYTGVYNNGNIGMLMWIMLLLFLIQVVFLVMDIIHQDVSFHEHLISYVSMIFTGSLSISFLLKKRKEKEE